MKKILIYILFTICSVCNIHAEFSLVHQKGAYNDFQKNGMQQVHTEINIVYANPGDTLRMYRPERMAFTGYIRWYCYDTDSAAQRIIRKGNYKVSAWDDEYTIINERGLFKRRWNKVSCGTGRQTAKRKSYYEADYIMNSDSIYRVAVDQSIYKDYLPYNDWRQEIITELIEPTLSKRIIYEMHQASEIASKIDSCVGEKYLEVHNIIAPIGRQLYIGPEYSFVTTPRGDTFEGAQAYEWKSRSNYYYNTENPIQMGIKENWQWNGAAVNPITCQFIGVKSNTAKTDTFTLRYNADGIYYNIAKFIVTFMDVNHVGPIANISQPHSISLLYEQDFNQNAPGTTALTYWNGHFHVDESSYGYYLPNMDAYRDHHCGEPNWCEYGVVNKQDIYGTKPTKYIYNHNDTISNENAAKYGYMLFIDGSERTGQVFNLKLNADLCPGSKMYFSAWVIDASPNQNGKSAPNLDFIVTGIDENNTEHSLATFTTGEFGINANPKMKQGEWYQIMFPIKIGASENYHTYKLKITNKGKSADGNDFAIDDIRIYVEKPAVIPIQASTSDCIDKAIDSIRAYIRVDYNEIDHDEKPLYYQWREGNNIVHADYYNIDGPNNTLGKINILSDSDITSTDTCSDLLAFDKYYRETDVPVIKYIEEEVAPDSFRYIMYIAMPIEVRINREYTSFVSLSPSTLGDRSGCGTFADMLVAGGTRITINDEITFGDSVVTVCGYRTYTLNIVLTKIIQDETQGELRIDTTHCKADWLIGDSVYVNSHPEIYKYSFDEIERGLGFYRQHVPSAIQMVNFLKNHGLLILDTASIVMNPGVSLSYTAFPLEGTAGDKKVCTTPRFLHINPVEPASNMMEVGNSAEVLPKELLSQPRIVRISNAKKNEGSFSIPLYLKGNEEEYIIDSVYMISSTNPNLFPIRLYADHDTMAVIDTILLHSDSLHLLEAGYDYTFHIAFKGESNEDRCDRGYTYFTLRIIPDVVTWYGGDWNMDINWDYFIPMKETNVILTPIDYKIEFDNLSLAQYDINYTENECNNIYFPDSASMYGLELITINGQAFIDVREYKWKWTLTSIPIKGAVSGDLFVKDNGESEEPFSIAKINQTVGTSAIDRTTWQVYRKEFDASKQKWMSATNSLNTPLLEGSADMIAVDCETNDGNPVIIRLPKQDNMYRYYGKTSHNWLDMLEDVGTLRGEDYGKPIWNGSKDITLKQTYDSVYLFGNPTFGYVNIDKLIEDNIDLFTGDYYFEPEGSSSLPKKNEDITYNRIYDDGYEALLPPYRGILLKGKFAANLLVINVDTTHLNPQGKIAARRTYTSSNDNNIATSVDYINVEESYMIYDMMGRKIGTSFNDLSGGIYILRKEKNTYKILIER